MCLSVCVSLYVCMRVCLCVCVFVCVEFHSLCAYLSTLMIIKLILRTLSVQIRYSQNMDQIAAHIHTHSIHTYIRTIIHTYSLTQTHAYTRAHTQMVRRHAIEEQANQCGCETLPTGDPALEGGECGEGEGKC